MKNELVDKPKYIYGAIINLGGGLLWSKPVKFTYDEMLDSWWYKGDFSIEKLGYDYTRHGYCTFSSVDKKEVRLFLLGAKTINSFINKWASVK